MLLINYKVAQYTMQSLGHIIPEKRKDWSFREELRTRPARKERKQRETLDSKVARLRALLASIQNKDTSCSE